jgi:hypothetical protein
MIRIVKAKQEKDIEGKLHRCRSKYDNREWEFKELFKMVRGVLKAHRLKNFINRKVIN